MQDGGKKRKWAGSAFLCLAIAGLHGYFIKRFYFLTDDAFISFRYARNLALGRGLVWNPGEYVEGYTNFLWTILMACGIKAGLAPEILSSVLSIAASFAVLLVLYKSALLLLRERIGESAARFTGIVAVLLLCINRSYNVWATGGLETRLFTLLIAIGLYFFFAEKPLRSGMAIALAALTRPDGMLFSFLLGFLFAIRSFRFSRKAAGHGLIFFIIPALAVSAMSILRYFYYGQWLPNTYYAKVGQPWPEMGRLFLKTFLFEYGLWLLVPVSSIYLTLAKKNSKAYLYLLILFVPFVGYYCYSVGGDHFEWRLFDPLLPYIALLLSHAGICFLGRDNPWRNKVSKIDTDTFDTFEGENKSHNEIIKFLNPGFRILICIWLLLLHAFLPLWPYFSRAQMLANTGVPAGTSTEVLGNFRHAPFLSWQLTKWRNGLGVIAIHLTAIRQELHKNFWEERTEQFKPFAGISWPEGSVTTDTGIGILGYYIDIPVIDQMGLTDAVIARTPRTGKESRRMMAHERMPPEGYLQRRGVTFMPICRLPYLQTDLEKINTTFPRARLFTPPAGGYVGRYKDAIIYFIPFDGSSDWVKQTFSELIPVPYK